MKYSSKTIASRNTFQTLLTQGLKDRIQELGLIDTGTMLRVTKAKVSIKESGLNVEVDSTEYFTFMDDDYNILNFVLDSPIVSNAMEDLIFNVISDEVLDF